MYEILVGRDEEDKKKYGQKGMFVIGKHYVQMNQVASLSNKILVDAIRPHVVFVCGKRGSGKSYTMAAMAEAMFELEENVKKNLSIIMIDTMGIYWTMKYKNLKDEQLLKEWEIEESQIPVKTYLPQGIYEKIPKQENNADGFFSIKTAELTPSDWVNIFQINETDQEAIIIGNVLSQLNGNYDIVDIISEINKLHFEEKNKTKCKNLFLNASNWGVFSKEGIEISNLLKGGEITVLDISYYTNSINSTKIKALITGLIAKKIFDYKMELRRLDELNEIKAIQDRFNAAENFEKSPLVWLMIDEAHEMLPKDKNTPATKALLTLLREGRQPGISLVLASQQPGQIHTDVLTQSDIVISHRLTAKIDTDALGLLMQTYMRQALDKSLAYLPDLKGAAIIFDDTNEKMYQSRIRPRKTWHGGSSPTAIQEKKEKFTFS